MPHLHMEMRRRKALAVRLAAATDVEGIPLPDADEHAISQSSAFLQIISAAANNLENDPEPSLTKSLSQVADRLESHKFFGEGPAINELRRRRDSFVRRLRDDICDKCAKGAGLSACDGKNRSHDDLVVAKGGLCIAALRELTKSVESEVRKLYERQAKQLPLANLRFATDRVQPHTVRGLFNEFGISGWTDLRDCTVGLEIKDRAFDRTSLCQALYVLAHEMVCHAFQGLEGQLRPQNADETCSWSEGWMDRMAFTLTRDWLETRTRTLPAWLSSDVGAAQDVCTTLHSRRFKAPVDPLDEFQIKRRDAARWAFDHLRRAWATTPKGSLDAEHRLVRFSLRLNLQGVSQKERETICQLLVALLVDEGSERYGLALAACDDFMVGHDDPRNLLEELKKLVEN